ncbi:MAG TPA: DivIVA domain-containing protein [Actinopolymorphaceae bacterium]
MRLATFTHRLRGWDENEVREFLGSLADEIQAADAERAALRAEIDRLRSRLAQVEHRGGDQMTDTGEINAHAVALFSQAQQVADRLVEEAVQQARDLMANARSQQREILERAHEAAARAAADVQAAGPVSSATSSPGGSGAPHPQLQEIEYVRTFAKVAQVQLRSVLDALTEQVDRLGQVPDASEVHRQSPDHDRDHHAEGYAPTLDPTDHRTYDPVDVPIDLDDPLGARSRELTTGPAEISWEPYRSSGTG